MGTTYTRQSSTEIVAGEVINAADFNNEFAQLVSAFAASTGHSHDGTAAEGGNVTKLLGTAITIGDGTAGTDIAVTFDGESSDGVLTWKEDEDHFLFSDDVVIDGTKRLYFNDEGGEYIHGDGTDLNLVSGADINIPANIGLTFVNDGEKIEGDGTDLTISGNNINLTATADVNIPSGVGITFATAEKIESDGTDLSITVGSGGDINIPADIGVTFGNDGEKIEGDGTDLTISGNNINLTATADVVVPANVGVTFGSGEKIEGDDTNLTVTSGGDVIIDAEDDIILDANGADVTLKDGGTVFGALSQSGGELLIKSGSSATTAMTMSGANVTFAGTVTIGSAGISEAELEILDGATVTTTELNIIDGDTSASATTVADADRVVFNDAGTMKQVAVTDLAAYFDDEITAMPNLVTTAATTVGALNSGSITSGFGTIDTGSSTITTTGVITAGGFTIGSAAILEAELEILDGANVTTAELNLLDGSAKSTSSITIADADAFIVIDGTTTKQIPASDISTYTSGDTTALAIALG